MAYKSKEEWVKNIAMQRLAVQVNTIRRSKGMTVAELAEASGYDTASIRRIENGTLLPDKSKNKDRDIANALGISLNQLWGRKRFNVFNNGQPKLTETERTAVTLIAPMLKVMSEEGRKRVLDIALVTLAAEGAVPKWEEYVPSQFKAEKKNKSE